MNITSSLTTRESRQFNGGYDKVDASTMGVNEAHELTHFSGLSNGPLCYFAGLLLALIERKRACEGRNASGETRKEMCAERTGVSFARSTQTRKALPQGQA